MITSWFRRHLNWTWFLGLFGGYCLFYGFGRAFGYTFYFLSDETLENIGLFVFAIYAGTDGVLNAWIARHKGRLWAWALIPIVIPFLNNREASTPESDDKPIRTAGYSV